MVRNAPFKPGQAGDVGQLAGSAENPGNVVQKGRFPRYSMPTRRWRSGPPRAVIPFVGYPKFGLVSRATGDGGAVVYKVTPRRR